MLEEIFAEVYQKFKLNFYRGVFLELPDRESSLTATEGFAAEVIYALDRPSLSEFARFVGISQPNATYRINSLVKKGYVEKNPSDVDRREYRLQVTPKFLRYYAISDRYIKTVMERIRERFTAEEQKALEGMLLTISRELMPEADEFGKEE